MKLLKKYGQNFLQDPAVAGRLARALESGPEDTVIEIGPGAGMLTGYLAAGAYRQLRLVEIDPRWAGQLREQYRGNPAVEVIQADFLKYEFTADLGEAAKQVKVAGNIPYYITSPIVFRLMEYHRFIARAVLMVQKEVADRLTARCGSRDYGIPTVFLAAVGRAQKLFDIAKENFRPVPKVDSSAIRLDFDRTADEVVDHDLFARLVRGTFQTRRKKIKNSLERIIGPDRTARVRSIDLNRRPEELSPEQFRQLANEVHEIYG